jgi:hypothetical protein
MSRSDAHRSKGRCPCRESLCGCVGQTYVCPGDEPHGVQSDEQDWGAHVADLTLFRLRGLISKRSPSVITAYGAVLTLAVRSASDTGGTLVLAVVLSALLLTARIVRQRRRCRCRRRGKGLGRGDG